METYNSQDFADYFNEFRYIDDEVKSEEDSIEDECKTTDDADTEWLAKVGLNPQVLTCEDNEDDKEDVLEDFCKSLTHRQATILRKKFRSAKATIRKKRRAVKIRDVRDVFLQNASTEATSTETRSRSETPDSLDSLSSPSPPEWLPEVGNASPTLSQGYHSNERTSPIESSSSRYSVVSTKHLKERGTVAAGAQQPSRQRNYSGDRSQSPNASRPFSCHSDVAVESLKSQSQFYVESKEAPFSRGQLQKRDPVAGSDELQSGVEILGFHNKGSLHGARSLTVLTQPSQYRDVSHSDIGLAIKDESEQEWGFESLNIDIEDDKLLCLDCTPETLGGFTYLDDLDIEDVRQLQTLILLELSFIYDQYKLHYSRRKAPKIKRKEVVSVFGIPLAELIKNDQKFVPYCKIPLILEKILDYLERFGLKEEGILRVPGSMNKIQAIKNEIDTSFYVSPTSVDRALRSCSVNDVTAVLKQFLRELPVPLLTNEYIEAFFLLDKITDKLDQLKALKALILLIPEVHRNTLRALLDFLAKVIIEERYNRMSLHNVAMIVAPNLFTSSKRLNTKGNNVGHNGASGDAIKRDLASEMKMAASTCHLTKLMIKYRELLFCVPAFLMRQIRANNDSLAMRRNLKENNKPKRWLLTRKPKMEIYRKINNEVDFQNGVIRISAHQMNVRDFPVQLTSSTTAWDVISVVLLGRSMSSDEDSAHSGRRSTQNRQDSRRALSELAPNSNLSCLVAAANSDSALKSHFLCEVGGNIGKRRLHHNIIVTNVYQSNPNAEWIVECQHHGATTFTHNCDFNG